MEQAKRRKTTSCDENKGSTNSLLFNVFNYDLGMMKENYEPRQSYTSSSQSTPHSDLCRLKQIVEMEYNMTEHNIETKENKSGVDDRFNTGDHALLTKAEKGQRKSYLTNVWDFDLRMMKENFDDRSNKKKNTEKKKSRTPLSPLSTNVPMRCPANRSPNVQFSPQTPNTPTTYNFQENDLQKGCKLFRSIFTDKTSTFPTSKNSSTCFSPKTPSLTDSHLCTGQTKDMSYSPNTHFSPNVPFSQHAKKRTSTLRNGKENVSKFDNVGSNVKGINIAKGKAKVMEPPIMMPTRTLDFNENQHKQSANDNYHDIENSEIFGFEIDDTDIDSEEEDEEDYVDYGSYEAPKSAKKLSKNMLLWVLQLFNVTSVRRGCGKRSV